MSYNFGAFPEWRYGLGTEVSLIEKWALQVELNSGRGFFKDYNYPTFDTTFFPPPDSLTPAPPPLVVQSNNALNVASKLSTLSVSVATNLNKNILFSGGITINRLKSKYFSDGFPLDINRIDTEILDATNRFQTLNPPYVLTESYNALDAIGVKHWLGIRLSIYWRFN